MRAEGIAPNGFTFDAAIRACAEDRQPRAALALLRAMQRGAAAGGDGAPRPTVRTYASALLACERVGDARAALRLLEEFEAEYTAARTADTPPREGPNEIVYVAKSSKISLLGMRATAILR